MTQFKSKNSLFNIIKCSSKIIICGIVFLSTIEICARVDDRVKYDADFMGKYNNEILYEYDKEGIRHNVPNSRFEKWKINTLGYRGNNINLNNSQIKIICFGQSETFGLYEQPDNEWPSQLEEKLNKYYKNVVVLNASIVGLGAGNRMQYFEKYIMPNHPDIVINYQNFYDYAVGIDNLKKKKADITVNKQRIKNKINVEEEAKANIRIFPKIKIVLKQLIPSWLIEKKSIYFFNKEIIELEKKHLKNKKPIDKIPEEHVKRFEEDLQSFIVECKNQSIIPVISTYPTLIDNSNKTEYKVMLLDARRFNIELSEAGIIDASIKFNNVIRKVATGNNLILIDNDRILKKNTENFSDFYHYTDKGAEIVAENIKTTLINSRVIDNLKHKQR